MTTSEEKPINLRGLDKYDTLIRAEINTLIDNAVFYDPDGDGIEGTLPVSEINDDVTGITTTWSSSKIQSIINNFDTNSVINKGYELANKSSFLEAVNSENGSFDFFVLQYNALINATDSPILGEEFHVLVLSDNSDVTDKIRKTVLAFQYTGEPQKRISAFYRDVWENKWVQPKWVEFINPNGYLPLTADSNHPLIGNLYFGEDIQAVIGGNDNALILQALNSERTEFRQLLVCNTDYQTNIEDAILFKTNESGESKLYAIYGEHNLPSALRTDANGSVSVLTNTESGEMRTMALFHEGNPPTAEVVGAATAYDHNIRTYNDLSQLGLSNDDMSTTDFLANIKAINTALGDGDVIVYLTTTNTDNFHLSTIAKLNADLGKSLDGNSTLSIKISRTGDIYNAITTDVVYNSSEEAMYVYSCIYNKEAEEADDVLSDFVVTTHPEGFLPISGGNITGSLTINNDNVATETYVTTMLGEGGVSSWNDLTDKPFYSESSTVTLLPEVNLDEVEIASLPQLPLEVGKEYIVTWMGVEYHSVCQLVSSNGMTGYVLGDIYTISGGMMGTSPTGEPFVIIAYPPEIASMIGTNVQINVLVEPGDGESITLSITLIDEVIHHIDNKYIKDMYYSEPGITVTILPEVNLDEADMASVPQLPLEVGKEYTVTWMGVEYSCICNEVSMEGLMVKMLGDVYTFSEGALGTSPTGEPFIIMTIPPEIASALGTNVMIQPLVELGDDDVVTISITFFDEPVHHIDSKYIKDMYYSEPGNVTLLPEVNLAEVDKADLPPISLESGKKYVVKWMGVEYTCTGQAFPLTDTVMGVVIGDIYTATNGEYGMFPTGEPFIIMSIPPEYAGVMGGGTIEIMPLGEVEGDSLIVSITVFDDIVHPIDKKYLPDDIPVSKLGITYTTEDLTPGETPLETGKIVLVYE